MNLYLGIDIGSVSSKLAVIDEEKNIILTRYRRHRGRPESSSLQMLNELREELEVDRIKRAVITGIYSSGDEKTPSLKIENEIICQARSAALLYPEARSLIEIGGQDSKLMILEFDEKINQMVISDFAMNTICAAGTGSFLDQQASRLNVSIDREFGQLALKSEKPPRIAGRCSVFAKTDMIHLQQEATPVHDIIAGLCFAVARNFVSCIARGKDIRTPVAFHGGVASNQGMVRAFRQVLDIGDDQFLVHPYHRVTGAIGAALIAREQDGKSSELFNLEHVEKFFKRRNPVIETLPPLKLKLSNTSMSPDSCYIPANTKKIDGFLGIDVGSISTNLAVIDINGKVLSKRYLMTAGRPIEAVQKGLRDIGKEIKEKVIVRGVCTTGSGRYLTGDFFGADIIKNEITAQATAAADIDPEVDTIFEIGGQDSKFISLDRGVIVDFEMNKVCAAGTGSFLEEQAEKLGVNIKNEFGNIALKAKNPCSLGERCTVFMETDLVSNQRKGAKTDDLVAGLCYSIVYNYLNKVVGDRRVGDRIFFQGGTAYNDGVVAAFEAVTGKKITVPDHHEVTGAIGCAIIAKRWYEQGKQKTRFKGFDRSSTPYVQDSFECKGCSNRCEIKQVKVEGEKPLFYGGRCEKYEIRHGEENRRIPDLFAERENLLLKEYHDQDPCKPAIGTVGIPRVLYNFEYMPFWVRFFKELGYRVVLSDPTNKAIINQGLEKVLAEACFPVKVAHGHLENLLSKDIDFLFIPSVIGMKVIYPSYKESSPCPYGQAIPYMLNSAFDLDKQNLIRVLSPVVDFSKGTRHLVNSFKKIAGTLGINPNNISKAVESAESAQEEFYRAITIRGKEILSQLKEEDNAVVIVSRPYNGCDEGINLSLPKKLRDLGALPIPLDFLPLDEQPIDKDWPFMTWRYGQKFIAAADIIRDDPRLNALFITNFGCGPDSFLMKFFRKRMGGKVYLQIEIDEHSADVGAITRCEAFLDSKRNIRKRKYEKYTLPIVSLNGKKEGRVLYLPYMCDHAYALKSAFIANGVLSDVLPESNMETLYWGRKFTTGKECYPCIITTGDFVKFIKSKEFDPDRTAFFMPGAGGGCRFGYYNILQRIVLDELNLNIPIYSPHQTDSLLEDLGQNIGNSFFRQAWNGVVAVDLLVKALRETRPYELNRGQTEQVYRESLLRVCNTILKKRDLLPVLKEAKEKFEKIPVDRNQIRPVIGLVGEIFVRWHRFSNNHLIESLEKLGAEVWIAPFMEWIFYLNVINKEDCLADKNMLKFAKLFLTDLIAKKDEKRLVKVWNSFLRSAHEPAVEKCIEMGSDYVDPSYRGESILSLGKAVDYYRSGLSGVINVMPFTCMPGTIVNSQLKRLKENCDNIPVLNVAYDGLDMNNNTLRLEAFVHQCTQYMQKNILVGVH